MANTGRERASTWRYHEQHAKAVFDNLGLTLEIATHDLATVDLYAHNGDLLLPAFTGPSGKLPTFCSNEWKKYVVRRYLRQHGYGPDKPILMWYGMSTDEIERLKMSDVQWIKNHYPLCFDEPLSKHNCIEIIKDFGLPEPPKSACWMCPHLNNSEWRQMQRDDPGDFVRAIELDHRIRQVDDKHSVYLHRQAVPLDQVDFTLDEREYPLMDCADSCWT